MTAENQYQQALQAAQTVAECQEAYDHELAAARRKYQDRYPDNYQSVVAAHEVDYWIKAENRAKLLKSHGHSYGNLIQRQPLFK